MKLLIGDDADTTRRWVSKYVQLHSDCFTQVYDAENGQEALDILLKYQPEILLLDAAEKAYGDKLDIMLSPWSPPAYMKTTEERNHGGKLKPEYRKRWAEYICRYIEEYRNRGYHVTKLTMQNDPKAVQT